MHEGEEEVHLYDDVDPVIDPLMIKVLRHCLGNPEDGKPSETIYCTTYNDEVKNMLLLFYDFNPDKDDMDTEMDDDIGFGGNASIIWVLKMVLMLYVLVLVLIWWVLKWVLIMMLVLMQGWNGF